MPPRSGARAGARGGAVQTIGPLLELPPYEAQIAPLQPQAKRKIEAVIISPHARNLKSQLGHAAGALSDTVGDINDRLMEARARLERSKRRLREAEQRRGDTEEVEDGANADGDGNTANEAAKLAERKAKLANLEQLVKEATQKMESSMRRIVDSEVQVEKLQDILMELAMEDPVPRQPQIRSGGRRPRRNGHEDEEDEDEDQEEEEEGGVEPQVEEPVESSSRQITKGLSEKQREWDALSLAQRYGTSNSYKQFYRVIHESKYSAVDVPPLPHPSAWFKNEVSRESGNNAKKRKSRHARETNRDNQEGLKNETDEDAIAENSEDDDEDEEEDGDEEAALTQEGAQDAPSDDEIAVKSEKFSITCPLTLQPFVDPVSSTKCPHSFERAAIESMISRSRQTTLVRQLSRNMRCVECPVCSVLITTQDLKSDPVLVRRVKRAGRMAAMEEEDGADDDEEEDLGEQDTSILMSMSRKKDDIVRLVKRERARSPSRIPDTQMDG